MPSNRAGAGITITYSGRQRPENRVAGPLAAQADIQLFCVGQQTGEGETAPAVNLPADQDAPVAARRFALRNPRTNVVIRRPAGTVMPWDSQTWPSAFVAVVSGQEGSSALAVALVVGRQDQPVRPTFAGVRFPGHPPIKSRPLYASLSTMRHLHVPYSDNCRWLPGWYAPAYTCALVIYPFGHGQSSYTTFAYRNLVHQIQSQSLSGQDRVDLDVQNQEAWGSETFELYLVCRLPAGEPPRQLKGFKNFFGLSPAGWSPLIVTLRTWIGNDPWPSGTPTPTVGSVPLGRPFR